MKRTISISIIVLLMLSGLFALGGGDEEDMGSSIVPDEPPNNNGLENIDVVASLAKASGTFMENRGQLESEDVLYYVSDQPLSVGLRRDGVTYTLVTQDDSISGPMERHPEYKETVFQMYLEGCNWVEPQAIKPLSYPSHFYFGNDPSKWIRGARSCPEVLFRGIYDGTDLRFYFLDGMFKYEFVLGPGSDVNDIVMRYDGIEGLRIEEESGDVLIETELGTVRDMAPVGFINSCVSDRIDTRFEILEGGICVFRVENVPLDQYPLTIDPGLQAATYIGDANNDFLTMEIALDNGSYLMGGCSLSPNFVGYPRGYTGRGGWDFYVVMMDQNLSSIQATWAAGGSGDEMESEITMISSTECAIIGITDSTDFPVTDDAFQSRNNGETDGVVAYIDIRTMELVYSTYVGGERPDGLVTVQRYPNGDILYCGLTNSDDLPTTVGAYCMTYEQTYDATPYMDSAFIGLYNHSLETFTWLTYLNGLAHPVQYYWGYTAFFPAIAPDGSIYLVGTTSRTDLPTTEGAYMETPQGNVDVFVMRMDNNGSSLMACTYLGGPRDDVSILVLPEPGKGVYVVGSTMSRLFPTTSNAYQKQHKGNNDKYVALLDENLEQLIYSTFVGGLFADYNEVFDVGPGPSQFTLLFETRGQDFNTTPGCFKPFSSGGETELYLCVIDIEKGTELVYGTFIGGSSDEYAPAYGCTYDGNGRFFFSVRTLSRDCYVTEGAFQTSYNGNEDIYLVALEPTPCDIPGPPRNLEANPGDAVVDILWDPPVFNGAVITEYLLYRRNEDDGKVTTFPVDRRLSDFVDYTVVNGANYTYWVQARNSMGWGNRSGNVTVRPLGYPSSPRNFGANTGDDNITLTWREPENLGGGMLTHYQLERGLSMVSTEWICDLGPGQTRYVDWNVSYHQLYHYKLRAINERNNGTWAIDTSTRERTPDAPTNLMALSDDKKVFLQWDNPLFDGGAMIEEIRIYKGLSPDNMSLYQDLPRNTESYSIYPLENGVEYWFFVVAMNKWGEGGRTPMVIGRPGTQPEMPTDLDVTPGDRQLTLTWTPPTDDGGRQIIGYHIYMKGPGDENYSVIAQNVSRMEFVVPSLRNGEEYSFEVSAINAMGEGFRSSSVEGIPMTVPSEPWDLEFESIPTGIEIIWNTSNSTGGGTIDRYWVHRGLTVHTLSIISSTTEEYFVDSSALAATRYYYSICAENAMGNGTMSITSDFQRSLVPDPPTLNEPGTADGSIHLSWSEPSSDGGSPINSYDILRGIISDDLTIYKQAYTSTSFTDTDVVNGRTYYYCVVARNDVGPSPRSLTIGAAPRAVPDLVRNLLVKVKDDSIIVTWDPPLQENRMPVTGYLLFKGTSLDDLDELVRLNTSTTTYEDFDVKPGQFYYYTVQADSDHGVGNKAEATVGRIPLAEPTTSSILPILLIVIVVVLVSVSVFVLRSRRQEEDHEPEMPKMYADDFARRMDEGSSAVEVPATVTPLKEPYTAPPAITQYIIEEALVVYRDGRLVTSCAREECSTQDADLMSGMLIAVQGLIQDGLEHGGVLESIKFGENLISMATGNHVVLAVVVYGRPGDELVSILGDTVSRIENAYSGIIEEWTGEPSALAGIDDIVMPIIERTSYMTREDVGAATLEKTVSVLSAIDFHRGYVRLKMAAVNTTDETIIDSAVEVHYDTNMLRLEKVEPESMTVRGDRILLGNVRPGERRTVALLFDPQICQGTHIDGHLSYYDHTGELKYVEMKRRHADVVCPIFFTPKNANKAMLRRLVKEKLHSSDFRVYRYPRTIPPYEVLLIAKGALGEEVQLVREYITRGPPYEAEVWYYAETRVKGYQFVIRLGVMEDKGVLEVFAASTAMEPITGLLADFRRELNVAYAEGRTGDQQIEVERDEAVRREMARRQLKLDIPEDDEVVAEDIAEA